MTVEDVKNAVIAYGFNFDLDENDGLFMHALNSAVQEIHNYRPSKGVIEIINEPYKPIYSVNEVTDVADGASFTAMARSAVFEVDGSGQVVVAAKDSLVTINGTDVTSFAWNAGSGWQRIEVRASAYTEITISFSGNYLFRMRNMEFYAEPIPPTAHIKSGDYIDYDLRSIKADFGNVSYILRNGLSYDGGGVHRIINDNVLRLPSEDRGTYEVVYVSRVPHLTDAGESIPLRDEVQWLLPILVASIVWLDDDPERAQYYRVLFERQLPSAPTERYVTSLRDVKGWT